MGRARLLPLLADEWTQLLDGPKCLDGVNEGGFNYSVVCVCVVCVCTCCQQGLRTRPKGTIAGSPRHSRAALAAVQPLSHSR